MLIVKLLYNNYYYEKKLIYNFNIKNTNVKYSEQYLSEGKVNTKQGKTYRQLIADTILRSGLLPNKKTNDFKLCWELFCDFVNNNDFKLYKKLALKIHSPYFRNFLNNKDNKKKPIENVCLIIHSPHIDDKYNTIALFVSYEWNNNLLFDVDLNRIEFLNMNLDEHHLSEFDIQISNKYEDSYSDLENILELYDYENIFDGEDYQGDPIKFKEWFELIEDISSVIDDNDKDIDKNIIKFKGNYIVLSENKITSSDSYFVNDNRNDDADFKDKEKSIKLSEKTKRVDLRELINNNNKELIEDNKGIKNQIDSNETDIWNNKKQIDQLDNETHQLNETENNLKYHLSKIQQEIEQLDYKKTAKQKDNNIDIEIKKFKKEKESLENELKKIENKININKNQIINLNNEIVSKKQDINSLNEKEKINSKHIEAYTSLLEYLNENKINNFYEIPNDNNHKISGYNIVEFPSIINSKSLRQLIINYSLITNTSGTEAIIKRMRNAINNVRDGFYKNPLFYYGIKKPDEVLKINNKNPLDNEIVQRYCLNSNQQKVLHKAINTNSVLYLQGPPGTGKTQTISAIVDWINKQGMNVVMTSSTHEAINNFFDRVSDNNKNNPNLVALKYSFMKKENNTNNSEEKFSETNIFKLFKQRMMNFVLGDNEQDNNKDKFKQQFNEYKKKYQLSIPSGYDSYLARPLVDFIFKNIKTNNQFLNNFKMIDDQERFLEPICYEEQHTLGIDKNLEKKRKNTTQINTMILSNYYLLF